MFISFFHFCISQINLFLVLHNAFFRLHVNSYNLIFPKFSLIILQYIVFYVHNYIYLYSFLLKKILNFLLHYHVIAFQIFSLSVLLCILFLFRILFQLDILLDFHFLMDILNTLILYYLGIFKNPSTILFCRYFFNICLFIFLHIPKHIVVSLLHNRTIWHIFYNIK